MKNLVKWLLIIFAGLFVLVSLVLILTPFFIDVDRFKPEIENRISEATGRPFSINGELSLSLFPWAGISISDSKMGNPEGFKETEFASIEAFDIRVKLIPLLFREIELKRFVLKKPRITLITQKDGRVNYDFSKGAAKKEVPEKKKAEQQPDRGLPIQSLEVGEFLISDGSILIIDHTKDSKQEISEISASLDDVSLDRPISLLFSAKIDQIPISLKGDLGPVGKDAGKGSIPVNLVLSALEQIEITVEGQLIDVSGNPRFDLTVKSSTFSPKKVLKDLNGGQGINTADTGVLNKLSIEAALTGTPEAVEVKNGTMVLDDSTLNFECKAKDFEKPDIQVKAGLDKIDADRYLPPKQVVSGGKTTSSGEATPAKETGISGKPDYKPLRSLVINGNLKAEDIRINNVQINDLSMKITGNRGIFKIEPLLFSLYDGSVNLSSLLNVQSDTPKTSLALKADKIQANPLINALLAKDIIEGGLVADVDIRMAGDNPEAIKRTLDGNVNIIFNDGAIKGIDLTAMAQNIKSAFGAGQSQEKAEQPRTDFFGICLPSRHPEGYCQYNSHQNGVTPSPCGSQRKG